MYELYQKRISVLEFLSLLSADTDWSHMASQKQTRKVFALFDKVYGFAKGLGRLE